MTGHLTVVERCPAWCVEEHTAAEIAQAGAVVCWGEAVRLVREDDAHTVEVRLSRSDVGEPVKVRVDDDVYTVDEAVELVGLIVWAIGEGVR